MHDDVYFNPSEDIIEKTSSAKESKAVESSEIYDGEEELAYYSEEDNKNVRRSNDNDYDFYYTSRIRRFNRSYSGFNYYDPCYVDAYYYNPAYTTGSTIYVTNYSSRPQNTYIVCDPYTGAITTVVAQPNYGNSFNAYGYNYAGYNVNNYSTYGTGFNGYNAYNDPFYCAPGYGNTYTGGFGNTGGVPNGSFQGTTYNYNGPRGASSSNAPTSTSSPTISNPRDYSNGETFTTGGGAPNKPTLGKGKSNNEPTTVKSNSGPTFQTTRPNTTKPRNTTVAPPRPKTSKISLGKGKAKATPTRPKSSTFTKPSPRPKSNYTAPKSTPRTYSKPKTSTPSRSYSAPRSSGSSSKSSPSRSVSPRRGGK